MSKKKRGLKKLIEIMGEQFVKEHEDSAVFSYGETKKGLHCFLGISLHPENARVTLSASLDDWDIYATCYVTDDDVIVDKCKLPWLNNSKIQEGFLMLRKLMKICKKNMKGCIYSEMHIIILAKTLQK